MCSTSRTILGIVVIVIALAVAFWAGREYQREQTVGENIEETLDRVGEKIEDGLEEAGDKVQETLDQPPAPDTP